MIELMIAVGLTALLLGMAVPAMTSFLSNARQTGVLNDLVSAMHLARSAAITTNTRVTVCPSSGGAACDSTTWQDGWIVFADRDSDQTVDGDETIIGSASEVDDLTIQSPEFGSFLMYRPNGRVMNAAVNGNTGEFTLCDHRGSDHAKVLIIDMSGRPRSSSTLADGSSPACS